MRGLREQVGERLSPSQDQPTTVGGLNLDCLMEKYSLNKKILFFHEGHEVTGLQASGCSAPVSAI